MSRLTDVAVLAVRPVDALTGRPAAVAMSVTSAQLPYPAIRTRDGHYVFVVPMADTGEPLADLPARCTLEFELVGGDREAYFPPASISVAPTLDHSPPVEELTLYARGRDVEGAGLYLHGRVVRTSVAGEAVGVGLAEISVLPAGVPVADAGSFVRTLAEASAGYLGIFRLPLRFAEFAWRIEDPTAPKKRRVAISSGFRLVARSGDLSATHDVPRDTQIAAAPLRLELQA